MFEVVDVQPKSKHNPNFPIRPVAIPVGPSIAYVELTQGKYALIDSADAEMVGRYNWRAQGAEQTFYARRYVRSGSKRAAQGLHTFLAGFHADHRNGNGLDNRRSANLRPSNQSQNNQNRRLQSNNSSGYKGVSWHAQSGRWGAIITANGARKYLGGFSTPEAAYSAYTQAAAELHGEFARVA